VGQERTELTGRLREDIERTRSDISWTIGEIEDRLKPERLMRQAREKVRGAAVERMRDMMNSANETAGRVADRAQHSAETVAGRVRENPLPLAAVAVAGLAWWMSRDKQRAPGAEHGDVMPRRSSQLASTLGEHPVQTVLLAGTVGYLLMSRQRRADSYRMEGFGDRMDRPGQDLSERAADTAHQTKEAVISYAGQARHTMSDYSGHARETIGEYVREAQGTASEATARLREKARHLAGDAQQRWQHTGPAIDRWIHDNPLAVGAAALAVGAAVGLSAPRTRAENRTLGETRDALVDKASTVAHDVREKVSETARTVVHDATEAAKAATPPVSSATTPSTSALGG